jgi:hypothetical protein
VSVPYPCAGPRRPGLVADFVFVRGRAAGRRARRPAPSASLIGQVVESVQFRRRRFAIFFRPRGVRGRFGRHDQRTFAVHFAKK